MWCFIYAILQCGIATGVPRNFVGGGGGFEQIQLRTEGRGNGNLDAVAP
jgi:hypothetical protein